MSIFFLAQLGNSGFPQRLAVQGRKNVPVAESRLRAEPVLKLSARTVPRAQSSDSRGHFASCRVEAPWDVEAGVVVFFFWFADLYAVDHLVPRHRAVDVVPQLKAAR